MTTTKGTKLAPASIAVASVNGAACIGSRVMAAYTDLVFASIEGAIEAHDTSKDRQTGQHAISVDYVARWMLSGVALRTTDLGDYVIREWRGEPAMFMRREVALPVEHVTAIVYTREAYCGDPEVDNAEVNRIGDATHVLVALLASAGPVSPLTPERLVLNLAGGNNEALAWTADEIRAKAEITAAYWNKYAVVAD
jgi:hypothetical protein